MKKLAILLSACTLALSACSAAPTPSVTPESTAAPTAPQVAAGVDSNPFTAKFAQAFCEQDAQGVYDSLANGSSTKEGLTSEADYYAQVIDEQTQGAAALVAEAGIALSTDVTALLAAIDVKAAALKAQNSPVAILAAEIKLPNGTTCVMTFKGAFTDNYGAYNAIYVIAYSRADGTTDENFFVLTAGNGGVEDVQ